MSLRLRFYSRETAEELDFAQCNAGVREWSHADLPDATAAHVAAGVLWVPAGVSPWAVVAIVEGAVAAFVRASTAPHSAPHGAK